MLKKIKVWFKQSVVAGSLIALLISLRETGFILKSTLLHFYNYHFRKLSNVEKINIGCGRDYKQGFLNIDMNDVADVYFDVRNRLPFRDGDISYIYSSHFLEHLTNSEIIRHFIECFRILKAGGVYRICIPDFRAALQGYMNNDQERLQRINNVRESRFHVPDELVCYADYLDRALHESGGHKVFLDFEKVRNMLVYGGFSADKIIEVEADDSIDPPARQAFSIFIEATR